MNSKLANSPSEKNGDSPLKGTVPLFLLALVATGDPFGDGLRAYREGKFPEALKAFAEAEAAAGEKVSPQLLYNKSLAALRAGDLAEAETAAEKAAARGGTEFAALRNFLLGSSAFTRCEQAEAVASSPESEPNAFDQALAHAESAKTFWQQAAVSRPDWGEARRNVERALLKIEDLKKKKEEREKNKKEDGDKDKNQDEDKKEDQDKKDGEKSEDSKKPEDKEKPPEPKSEEQKNPEQKPEPQQSTEPQKIELSPEQIKRLVDKLNEKEREKQQLRQAQRGRKTRAEKDW